MNMDENHDSNAGNDALRQQCIGILQNYMPIKRNSLNSNSFDSSTMYRNASQAKSAFRAKNEVYVQAVRDVVRLNRAKARQRNLQAFKGFLNDIANEPVNEEEVTKNVIKSPKTRKMKRNNLDEKRVLPIPKQGLFLPIIQQDVFYPHLQQTELQYQIYDQNDEILKQMEMSYQQANFYQTPFHPSFYLPYQTPFNSGYYQQDPNNVYSYQG